MTYTFGLFRPNIKYKPTILSNYNNYFILCKGPYTFQKYFMNYKICHIMHVLKLQGFGRLCSRKKEAGKVNPGKNVNNDINKFKILYSWYKLYELKN